MSGSMNGAPFLPSVVKLLLRRSFRIQTNCKLRLSEPHNWDDPQARGHTSVPGSTQHPVYSPYTSFIISLFFLSIALIHPSTVMHPQLPPSTWKQMHKHTHANTLPSYLHAPSRSLFIILARQNAWQLQPLPASDSSFFFFFYKRQCLSTAIIHQALHGLSTAIWNV